MQQLLREWPPGYGGVERVAHGLATELGGTVIALRRSDRTITDPLPVTYKRLWLPAMSLGRLLIPLPSPVLTQLLISQQPLLAHLPCPAVLFLALLARLLRPRRSIRFYWHAFLEPRPGVFRCLDQVYQRLALRLLRHFEVVTTSPILLQSLRAEMIPSRRLHWLACALPETSESPYGLVWQRRNLDAAPQGRLIAIGRLNSYKRFDWLIRAVASTSAVHSLDLIGEGPDRPRLEALARELMPVSCSVRFHGRVSEERKQQLMAEADLLVLPADRCNEAFGIVQLEAMACGIPSLAFDLPRSGTYWVSHLPELPWSGRRVDLSSAIQTLLSQPDLYQRLAFQARHRYERVFSLKVWRRQLVCLGLDRG